MSASALTRKGQLTLPKPIRDRLGIRQGEKVFFVIRGEEVVLKVLRGTILDLKGSVTPSSQPEDFKNIRETVKKVVSAKVSRHG